MYCHLALFAHMISRSLKLDLAMSTANVPILIVPRAHLTQYHRPNWQLDQVSHFFTELKDRWADRPTDRT